MWPVLDVYEAKVHRTIIIERFGVGMCSQDDNVSLSYMLTSYVYCSYADVNLHAIQSPVDHWNTNYWSSRIKTFSWCSRACILGPDLGAIYSSQGHWTVYTWQWLDIHRRSLLFNYLSLWWTVRTINLRLILIFQGTRASTTCGRCSFWAAFVWHESEHEPSFATLVCQKLDALKMAAPFWWVDLLTINQPTAHTRLKS